MSSTPQSPGSHPFLEGLPAEMSTRILRQAQKLAFDPGQYLFKEGLEADRFYLVEAGRISLEVYVPNHGPVTVENILAGDVVGWSWLFLPHRWHFDARALERSVLTAIEGEKLRELMEADHDLGYQMMKKIARTMESRLQATRIKLMEFYNIFPAPDREKPSWQKLL